MKSWSRERSRSSKRTVRSSSTTTRASPATCVWKSGDACLPDSIVKLCSTSRASTGSPLLKRAFGFRRKVIDERSDATFIDSASRPYIVCGSSCAR